MYARPRAVWTFLENDVAENAHGAGMTILARPVQPFLACWTLTLPPSPESNMRASWNCASATPKVEGRLEIQLPGLHRSDLTGVSGMPRR